MRNKFVQTENVTRFLAATAAIEDRGAKESCIVLAQGDAGLGKSRTAEWWAVQNDAIHLRLKAAASPHWVLNDLVKLLGEQAPAHSSERLFNQAVGYLAKNPRPIVVDEVENGLSDIKVLETIRDITDMVLVPAVFVGREYVWGKLARYKHFRTRIGARADFAPATLDDTQRVFTELCEVPVEPAVVEKVHAESDGHIREIVNAVKNAERIGKRNKGECVTLALVGDKQLVRDWQRARKAA